MKLIWFFNDICNRGEFTGHLGLECRMIILNIWTHILSDSQAFTYGLDTPHPGMSHHLAICRSAPGRWLEIRSLRASQGWSLEPTIQEGLLCPFPYWRQEVRAFSLTWGPEIAWLLGPFSSKKKYPSRVQGGQDAGHESLDLFDIWFPWKLRTLVASLGWLVLQRVKSRLSAREEEETSHVSSGNRQDTLCELWRA